MHLSASPSATALHPAAPLAAPAWLDALCPAPWAPVGPFDLALAQTDGFTRVEARVKGALRLSAEELEAQVESLYAGVFAAAKATGAPHAVRFWNGLPRIIEALPPPAEEAAAWEKTTPVHEIFDRYMAFNTGRCRAFLAHYGSTDALARAVPAGTGVGHGGSDLVVHGLFAATTGTPVENPRQTSAFRYSPRFGPLPPCFARATRLEAADRSLLLVSGTASITGEETRHGGETAAHVGPQAKETFRNLEALLGADGRALADLHDVRAYVTHARDFAHVRELCLSNLPGLRRLEIVHAEICRPGLILEIEGLAG